jgi:hypothetical protein
MNNNISTQNPFGNSIFGAPKQDTSKSIFNNPVKPTAPSAFNFGPTLNAQQPSQGFFNVKNTAPVQNGFFTTAPSGLSTNTAEREDSLSKIEKIISQLKTPSDDATIKNLYFKLNYLIEGIYNNTPEAQDNFSRMHQLSTKLENANLNTEHLKFFLKIHAESNTFLKYENKDWLAKNLFRAAFSTKDALSQLLGINMHCVVSQNFDHKNKISVKFFPDQTYTSYEYVLGEFPTKESFINSVFFDISCFYICALWDVYNLDYKSQIKTNYNTKDFAKSTVNVAISLLSKPNITLAVGIKVQDLFINQGTKSSHNLEKWFTKLDEIATRLNLIDNTNLTVTNTVDTLSKADTASHIKAISDIEVFYKTLTFFLDK